MPPAKGELWHSAHACPLNSGPNPDPASRFSEKRNEPKLGHVRSHAGVPSLREELGRRDRPAERRRGHQYASTFRGGWL